jgi:LPS sulfotransferase NodH
MTAYRRMHHDEVDGAAWDRAPGGTPPAHRVVICSTPRSGSYLMCRQMINAGIGVPHEYFRGRTVKRLAARYGVPADDVDRYVDALEARRTTANGVFASKLQWQQLASLPRLRERVLARADLVVFLYRRDLVAQAVSWQISLATGYWSFDTTVGPRAPGAALDDTEQALHLAAELLAQNRAWESLLATLGPRVLRVPYESYVRDQPDLLRQVATGLALPPRAWTLPAPEARESRLPDEVERARERLLAHARAATAAARP